MASILIVDDLISIHEMLEAVIQPTGHRTAFATDGEKALVKYKAEKFDMVLADIDMKPMDGITLLKQLKQFDPTVVVIIMTAYASTESAIQALKFGAFDYLQKPFKVDELMQALRRSLEFRKTILEREAQGSVATVKASDFEARLAGQSPKVKRLISQLRKLATAHTPVLISGEPGTGHEIAAELLHAASNPPESPMVRIDCRLSTKESLRTGLLGDNGSGGTWVQEAKGGTLFLTHLQSLPKETQAELISVLRNNAHAFRLICATEEDLEKLSEAGEFNEELFYRVAALPVEMPPMRDRVDDIPLLIKSIAAKISNAQLDARQIEFSEDAIATLRSCRWQGNLAEFTQVISQVLTNTESRIITPAHLPLRIQELKDWPKLSEFLAGQEKLYISRVLNACQGDKVRASRILGVDAADL
jgi:two-component system, NtrC family, response regulator HydG